MHHSQFRWMWMGAPLGCHGNSLCGARGGLVACGNTLSNQTCYWGSWVTTPPTQIWTTNMNKGIWCHTRHGICFKHMIDLNMQKTQTNSTCWNTHKLSIPVAALESKRCVRIGGQYVTFRSWSNVFWVHQTWTLAHSKQWNLCTYAHIPTLGWRWMKRFVVRETHIDRNCTLVMITSAITNKLHTIWNIFSMQSNTTHTY